jgi:hypothetical protein
MIGRSLKIEFAIHDWVGFNLFFEFRENGLSFLPVSCILADQGIHHIFPAVDGHPQPEGDVIFQFIVHAQQCLYLTQNLLVNY